MTDLTVRRLLIDLETPIERHWFGGDAFRTALFNALSMSFPIGEQFFIDSVRGGMKVLPPERQADFRDEAQGFIGQEATHRRIHALFNAHLEKQGLVNAWEPRARWRLTFIGKIDPRHHLALTAANEHFTALFAEWMLGHADWLVGTEARLQTMWLWHSAEESEHKSTAFDLYKALDGSELWRMKWMRRVTFFFLTDALRQTVNNLYHDGTLWKWTTWTSAASFLFGKRGMFSTNYRSWRDYFKPDFHPTHQHSELSREWLQRNAGAYSVVGQTV